MIKTRYCPTVELERTGVPRYGQPTALKMTLLPAIDENGNKARPTIIEANIIGISTDDTDRVVYDGIQGGLGDLMVTHNDSAGVNVVSINERGELILAPLDDDIDLYSRSREDGQTEHGQYLMYNDPFSAISYATVVDSNNQPISDVWIQMKKVFNDVYVTHTDSDGFTYIRGKDGERYQVVLAKQGYNQLIIENWKFVEGAEVKFIYPLIEKTIWDGMYSDTDAHMYVDVHDGGNA